MALQRRMSDGSSAHGRCLTMRRGAGAADGVVAHGLCSGSGPLTAPARIVGKRYGFVCHRMLWHLDHLAIHGHPAVLHVLLGV